MNKHAYRATCRYIFRHILRVPLKSMLVVLVTFAIFLTLGWLQETIDRNELEVNRLYESTYVFGQIIPREALSTLHHDRNLIRRQAVDAIVASELVVDIYYESATPWVFAFWPEIDIATLYENLNVMIGEDTAFSVHSHSSLLNQVIAISDLDLFADHHATPNIQIPGAQLIGDDIGFEFATNFDQTSFVYTDERLATPVPVLLSEDIMLQNGFELEDVIAISYNLSHERDLWEQLTAVIIGVHKSAMTGTVLMPLSAWEFALSDDIGFSRLEFIVDPLLNRDIYATRGKIEDLIRGSGAGFVPLMLDLHDEELRFVVQTLEETVSLLWLLYPVVVTVSLMIAGTVSFFLTLQNAKNVAVMRIFGETREKTGVILWFEQVILCVSGLTVGIGVLISLDWGFGLLALLGMAGLYLISVMAGSIVGIVVINRQSPLELLQTKE